MIPPVGAPSVLRRVLITAGPTHEAIDPVRYIANRSSGKMGYALAAAAAARGCEVDLVSGPCSLATPHGVRRHDVTSTLEMRSAVAGLLAGADLAIYCAAVADFRPVESAPQKIKKHGKERITLELVANPDLLAEARARHGFTGILVGFAAETEDLARNAHAKMAAKGCDWLVANNVAAEGIGFGSDENEVLVFSPKSSTPLSLPRAPKAEIASRLIDLFLGPGVAFSP